MPYLTPDEIPEGDTCRPLFIPDSTEWLAIISGALTELTQAYNWEQFGAVTVEEAVDRMQALVDQYYADACGDCDLPIDGPPTRIGDDGYWQEWDGDSWGEPTGDRQPPAVPAREDPTPEERRCLAAKNAANILAEMYEQAIDYYNIDVDPWTAFGLWIGVGSTKIMLALGFLSGGSAAFLFAFWNTLYAALEFLAEDVWDSEFTDKLACMLFDNAIDTSGVVLFDWGGVLRDLLDTTDWFDGTFAQQKLFFQIYMMLMLIGRDGLNLAGATTEIEEADCDYCGESCVEGIYLLNGNGYPSPWYLRTGIANFQCSPEVTIYDALADALIGCPPTINLSNIQAEATYSGTFPFTVASVHIVYEAVSTRSGVGAALEIFDRIDTTPRSRFATSLTQTGGGGPIAFAVTFGTPITFDGDVLIRVRAGAQANSGVANLYSLILCPVE